jgi:hypothetical protein
VWSVRLCATRKIENDDLAASGALPEDCRVEPDFIAAASIPADESVTFGMVNDAPTGNDYYLAIRPLDSAEGRSHEVPVGNLADLIT